MQDLDERFLKPRDFEPILDSADESYRVNLCANIFEQTSNERWKTTMGLWYGEGGTTTLTWTCFRVSEKVLPQIVVILLLCEVDCLDRLLARDHSLVGGRAPD